MTDDQHGTPGQASEAAAIVAKVKARSSLAETTVELFLDGKLYGQWKDAERELHSRAATQQANSLAGDPEARRLAELVADLEAQLRSSRVVVTLRSLGRRWNAIALRHPPRDGNQLDAPHGLNVDTLFPEVMPLSMVLLRTADDETVDLVATDVDGDRTPLHPDLIDTIADSVSEQQWTELCSNVLALNMGQLAVPFSRAASTINRISGGDSSKPNDSASPTSGSTDGNPAASSSTSTTSTGGSPARSRRAKPSGTTNSAT